MDHTPSLAERIAATVMDAIEANGRIAKSDIELAVQTAMLTYAAEKLPGRSYADGYLIGYDAGFKAGVASVYAKAEAETAKAQHPMGTLDAGVTYVSDPLIANQGFVHIERNSTIDDYYGMQNGKPKPGSLGGLSCIQDEPISVRKVSVGEAADMMLGRWEEQPLRQRAVKQSAAEYAEAFKEGHRKMMEPLLGRITWTDATNEMSGSCFQDAMQKAHDQIGGGTGVSDNDMMLAGFDPDKAVAMPCQCGGLYDTVSGRCFSTMCRKTDGGDRA